MSQAGITRADKVKYLEANGWTKLPRKHGAETRWEDPAGFVPNQDTDTAYAVCKRRVEHDVPQGRRT